MRVNQIEGPADGPPVLLEPDGILLRWPRSEPVPEVGDNFEGQVLHLKRVEHRPFLLLLLHGTVVERCQAACKLPTDLVQMFYSPSMTNNLRRVGRRLLPTMVTHLANLIQAGHRISIKDLIFIAAGRSEAEQLRRLEARR